MGEDCRVTIKDLHARLPVFLKVHNLYLFGGKKENLKKMSLSLGEGLSRSRSRTSRRIFHHEVHEKYERSQRRMSLT